MFAMIKCTFLILLLASINNLNSYAQTDKAEAGIQRIMQQYNAIGVSVAVVKNGKMFYTQSFGLKDVENNTPLTDRDIFRIASISKSFSATSIMQLIKAGKLKLSDDFSDLVGFKIRNPKYPETVITLKMVMSHTSSINDSQGYFNLDVINPEKSANWANCYNDYEPGKDYQYCNLNYNMIGTLIEKLSGERFDLYVKHHVLDPLKLYGGYLVDSLDRSRFVTLYEYDRVAKKFTPASTVYNSRSADLKNYVMGKSTLMFSPTGGMKISATDLAKYMTMHMYQGKYNGVRVISKKSAKLMQTQIANKEGYGLAIRTVPDLIPGKIMKGHTGSAYGLYSAMFFHPKEKFGIVVITNGCIVPDYDDISPMLRAAINELYEDLIK
jgi:CubicO group peptidase (beta-lactamase class C family)